MSLEPKQLVADSLARLFAAVVNAAPKPAVRFPEIAGRTTSVSIPTRHGETAATVYHPPAPQQRPAVYVNAHGGGFVVGQREQDDPWCRYLASHANVVVVNTDYVLAPRKRFPAPAEQLYDAVQWASSPEREWDGARLCVGGQSAGGNLAAAAARLALEGGGPRISLQVLHYPPLDLVTRGKDKHTPLGGRAVLKPWMSAVFDTAYVPDPQTRRHPLVSPAWGSNGEGLAGIAPAVIIAPEYDRLRDEAWAYAQKLDAVGSLAEFIEVPEVDHGYNIMSGAPGAAAVTLEMYGRITQHVIRAVER
jgi:acetyl esterase